MEKKVLVVNEKGNELVRKVFQRCQQCGKEVTATVSEHGTGRRICLYCPRGERLNDK